MSNAVNNQKYNSLNFIPLVLFNQFKLFFNFFQLAINFSQFFAILKVGNKTIKIRLPIHLPVPIGDGNGPDTSKIGLGRSQEIQAR